MQKSLAFLYTNNEKSKREIKESIPFTMATKRIKYLGINLPMETKELYTENYDTDERNQRLHTLMKRYFVFLAVKNQYCENDCTTNHSLQIQCNSYQILMTFFTELEQKISQFIWKQKRS